MQFGGSSAPSVATSDGRPPGETGAFSKRGALVARPTLTELRRLRADDRERVLVSVFNQFDRDGSGELEESELFEILTLLGLEPSRAVVKSVLAEIDTDLSGSIDCDEFLEFFSRMDELHALESQFENEYHKHAMHNVIMRGYFIIVVAAFIACTFIYVRRAKEATTGLLIAVLTTGALVALGIVGGLVMPILSIALSTKIQSQLQARQSDWQDPGFSTPSPKRRQPRAPPPREQRQAPAPAPMPHSVPLPPASPAPLPPAGASYRSAQRLQPGPSPLALTMDAEEGYDDEDDYEGDQDGGVVLPPTTLMLRGEIPIPHGAPPPMWMPPSPGREAQELGYYNPQQFEAARQAAKKPCLTVFNPYASARVQVGW
mmetsp:Transcript_8384/g.18157  ORF Transcript_8384/g.18157 Transcript_8384/m.18157 type:complete len:373 (-) Transcript_8384:543-1661(-)